MVVFLRLLFPKKCKRHSRLSPIVVACCKSKKDTTKARRYLKKSYLLPGTNEDLIVQVELRWELVYGTLSPPDFLEFGEKVPRCTSTFSPQSLREPANSS
jgi:hypothetical protein